MNRSMTLASVCKSGVCKYSLVLFLLIVPALASCGDDDDGGSASVAASGDIDCFPDTDQEIIDGEAAVSADISGQTITLAAHSSFLLSEGTLDAFTEQTGATVEVLSSDDAGAMVAQAILTKGNPVADVMFGIDNTFVCRGLAEDIFVPYAANVDLVPDMLTDPASRVTPVDWGDVCVNYTIGDFDDAPTSFDDLRDEKFKDQLVVQNPESSSPGLAFLLATVAEYGEEGWEDYWKDLRANGVRVTEGWSDAYYEDFSQYGGDRGIVVSYATSPVAEVIFADPVPETSPTSVMTETCYRQFEYVGVLAGTDQPEAAAQLVDFLLSDTVQNDIPLNMFVYPSSVTATVPESFVEHSVLPDNTLALDPDLIAEKRDEWTQRWVEIVLR